MVGNGAEAAKTEETVLLSAGQGGVMKTSAMYQDLIRRADEDRLKELLEWADHVDPDKVKWQS